jgi:hypothetical protein
MKAIFEAFVAVFFVVMWGHVQVVDAFVVVPQVMIQLNNRRRTSSVSKSLSMSTPVSKEGNLLKFGSRIPSKQKNKPFHPITTHSLILFS